MPSRIEYQKDLKYFENQWKKYLKERGILQPNSNTQPEFPVNFDVKEDYAIENGISETIVAKLRGNRYELNVIFKEKLRPKGNSFDQAPDPDIEEFK